MTEENAPKLKLITKDEMNARANIKAAEPKVEPTKTPVIEPAPSIKEKVEPVVAELKQEEKGTAKLDAEGKVIEEPKKRRTAKEISKPFSVKKEEVVEEGEYPEPVRAKISAYEKKINDLEAKVKATDEDSGYQLLVEARKLGKDAIDLFDQVKGEDVSKLSDLQLLELDLRKAGVKDSSDVEGDEASLEEEIDKFKALPKTARDREIKAIRDKYKDSQAGVANEFLEKLKGKNQERESVTNADRQKQIADAVAVQKELDSIADAYIGQEHYAVTGTPQLIESIKNFDLADYLLNKETGRLDANKLFDLKHYILTNDLRLENLENQFFAEGHDTLKSEVEVTGKSAKSAIVRSPQSNSNTSTEPAKLKAISAGHESVRV